MSVTVLENLTKEYKKAIRENYRGYELHPPLPKIKDFSRHSEMYVVEGVENKYFKKLNKTIVKGVPKGIQIGKRVLKSTGEVERDSEGNIVREPVSIPKGMTAVLTPIQLGLPWGYLENKDEMQYIDFFTESELAQLEEKNKYYTFLYLLDNKYLFPYNQIALVYSNKKLAKTYITFKIQTWKNGVVYLSLIPFENNVYSKAQVLSVGTVNSFKNVIPQIIQEWVEKGFICNPSIFKDSEEGESLVYQQLDGNLDVPTSVLSIQSVAEIKGSDMVSEENLFDVEL